MKPQSRRLGRGLSSLIAEPKAVPVTEEKAAEPSATPGILQIPVTDIVPNTQQPRQHFDEQALKELASSIKSAGLMQPIIVRSTPHAAKPWELIAGERRWRAASLAGMRVVPAIVSELSDSESAIHAVIENVQREDLNPIERGFAYRRLNEKFGLQHAEIATRVGIDRTSVTNLIRLTELDPELRHFIAEGKLSAGHAKVLLSVEDPKQRNKLAAAIISEGWSVRQLERELRRAKQERAEAIAQPSRGAANMQSIEKQLSDHLGTKVKLTQRKTPGAGSIEIEFYNSDHFEDVIQRMGASLQS